MHAREPGHRYVRGARVFTAALGQKPIEDGVVVLENSKIVDVRPAATMENELDTGDVAHYPKGTILPGLVDAHTHLTMPADRRPYEEMMRDPDEMMALISLRNLRRHLAAGVTTLRDNGGRNRVTFIVREAINRGYFEGPRLLLSGRPVTPSRGHFHWCNGVADGVDAIRAVVRELVAEGADHIKIMASGGGTAGTQWHYAGYTVDELRAIVATAHELGRPTTAHCLARQSMVNALDAGLDCIEHGLFIVPPHGGYEHSHEHRTGSTFVPMVVEYDPRITERIVESGTFLSFTMQALADTLVELRAKQEQDGLSKEEQKLCDYFEDYTEKKYLILGRFLQEGLLPRLVVSTDAGPYDIEFGNIHLGIEMVVEAGMSPAQALEASTRIAAEACYVADLVGTVEAGKEADLLVVEGDPLADVRCVGSVLAVYKGGELVAPWDPPDVHERSLRVKAHWPGLVGASPRASNTVHPELAHLPR